MTRQLFLPLLIFLLLSCSQDQEAIEPVAQDTVTPAYQAQITGVLAQLPEDNDPDSKTFQTLDGRGFDIELFFHNQINNDSDNIDQTVNYVDVIDTVKRINSSNSFNLIETLCNNLINEIVELYKPLKTTVRIRKFKLPIDTPLSFIEVEMTKENDV